MLLMLYLIMQHFQFKVLLPYSKHVILKTKFSLISELKGKCYIVEVIFETHNSLNFGQPSSSL